MKRLILLAMYLTTTVVFAFENPSYQMQPVQLSANPPGLQGKTPPGLQGRTPGGWSHGQKRGWNHAHHYKHTGRPIHPMDPANPHHPLNN